MSIGRIFAVGCLGVALASASLSLAQAQTLRVMQGSTPQPLEVPLNRAVVVESDTAFAELSIANPGIADISTLSDKTIYVLGKAPGRTTMTLLGADGRLISNVDVSVSPDVAEFKERLQQILPGEHIEVRTANDGIVLSGTVSSAAKLDRALDLAARYAQDRVSNLMSVGGTQQVMLKVRFAEMQRSVSKNLSASLGISGGSTSGLIGGTGQLAQTSNLTALLNGGASSTLTSANQASGRILLGGGVMGHLILPPDLIANLGPAVTSGRSVLMYGPPGNGKSSISNGIRAALGDKIYIPRAIDYAGQVITVYDPIVHSRAESSVDTPMPCAAVATATTTAMCFAIAPQ